MINLCRAEHQETGEGWFHHQETNKDPLSLPCTQNEGGQEEGSSLWIWCGFIENLLCLVSVDECHVMLYCKCLIVILWFLILQGS